MPLAQACLASDNPYQRKGGLMCLGVLAEGCGDHIRTKYGSLTRVRRLPPGDVRPEPECGRFSSVSPTQDAANDAADGVPVSL